MRKKKLRNTRPKALFGEVAAAGITAAATLAAAGIGAAATAKAAKEQSAATIENAKQQAASIEATNINNNQLQQQSQQFIAQENEANRQIQRDLQMNLQLQGGALDTEQRRMASRIQVKKGGRVKSRKKLRDAEFPLRGSILGAKFTDGSDTPDGEFLGYTPEGYPAVKAKGDKHVEYHKDGNRWRSGIGLKIPGQPEIEVENDEVVIRRPNDYVIFSNTSRHGLKPSKLIEEGMPADDVLAFQEMTNREQGNSPVRRNRYAALAGASTNYILPTDYPLNDLGFDMSGINVAAARRQLKKGGRCKAWAGTKYPAAYRSFTGYNTMNTPFAKSAPASYNLNFRTPASLSTYAYNSGLKLNPEVGNLSGITPMSTAYELNNGGSQSNKSFYDRLKGISGNLWGAGIGALGNLGGAWLTSWGANRASKYLSRAYTDAGNILANAYDKLQGVDMSSINREMFRNQHYMPVLRSSVYNVNPQLEDTNREFRRLMKATNAGTLSTAARLSRMTGANVLADEQRSKIYAEKANREEAVKQKNAEMSNEAAARNAELDVQASRDFTGHFIDLLKYNNDIANERITGRAQALADARMGEAATIANARQAIGQSWGNAVDKVGQQFGNALITDYAQNKEIDIARMQATRAGELSFLKRLGTAEERDDEISRLYSIINDPNSSDSAKQDAQRDLMYLSSDIYDNTRFYRNLMWNYGLSGKLRSLRTTANRI